jgi:hypothetical protein
MNKRNFLRQLLMMSLAIVASKLTLFAQNKTSNCQLNIKINDKIVGNIPLYLDVKEWNKFEITLGPLDKDVTIMTGASVKLTDGMTYGIGLLSIRNDPYFSDHEYAFETKMKRNETD